MIRLIIHALEENLILAVRAAKALEPGRKDMIVKFENETVFYIRRNKRSITVWQEAKL